MLTSSLAPYEAKASMVIPDSRMLRKLRRNAKAPNLLSAIRRSKVVRLSAPPERATSQVSGVFSSLLAIFLKRASCLTSLGLGWQRNKASRKLIAALPLSHFAKVYSLNGPSVKAIAIPFLTWLERGCFLSFQYRLINSPISSGR